MWVCGYYVFMDIESDIRKLRSYVEAEAFKGYDPYDALNSPLLNFLTCNLKYARIFFIQVLKRLPFNIRVLLGIKKGLNPKALGLFLWGYAKLYAVDKRQEYLERINLLLDLLDETKSKGYSGNCWGYNFNWQSRAFYVPRYTPTIVNSSFIGHALIDTYRITGINRAIEMALPIRNFILNDLNRKVEEDDFCFSYTPIDKIAVHNASLLGASLLIRLNKYDKSETAESAALSGLRYSMKYQRGDGAWYYAETDYQGWIDSFHTGFNLQSIRYFFEEGFAEEYKKQYQDGIVFYRDNFFLEDGTPKYYHNRVYPIDIHAPSQALVFFSGCGEAYKDICRLILAWMQNNMKDEKGYFYFQKTPSITNRIPYIRWGQAWTFHALTECLYHEKIERNTE